MSEKKKLTSYELKMLASAYNLKNYCRKNEDCEDCIFVSSILCSLTDTRAPYLWELEEGDKNEKTDTNC